MSRIKKNLLRLAMVFIYLVCSANGCTKTDDSTDPNNIPTTLWNWVNCSFAEPKPSNCK